MANKEITVVNEYSDRGVVKVILEPNSNRCLVGKNILTIRRRYCRGFSNNIRESSSFSNNIRESSSFSNAIGDNSSISNNQLDDSTDVDLDSSIDSTIGTYAPYSRETLFHKNKKLFEIKIILDKKRAIIERISSQDAPLYMNIYSTIPMCYIITMIDTC
jgi:hypothetical protein